MKLGSNICHLSTANVERNERRGPEIWCFSVTGENQTLCTLIGSKFRVTGFSFRTFLMISWHIKTIFTCILDCFRTLNSHIVIPLLLNFPQFFFYITGWLNSTTSVDEEYEGLWWMILSSVPGWWIPLYWLLGCFIIIICVLVCNSEFQILFGSKTRMVKQWTGISKFSS